MKKFLALALAILMMAAIAVPAFAAELDPDANVGNFSETVEWTSNRYGDGNDDQDESNYLEDAESMYDEETRIEYGVAQAYTVTIPSDVRLYEFTDDTTAYQTKGNVYGIEELSVSDVVINGEEKICIYITSAQWDATNNAWRMVDREVNNVAGQDGPSADVNYKIAAADVAYDGLGAAIDAPENYLLDYASADNQENIILGEAVGADSLVLTQDRAPGNAGTTGSSKTVRLYFSSLGTAQEGTYRDILTFTIQIEADAALDGTTGRA